MTVRRGAYCSTTKMVRWISFLLPLSAWLATACAPLAPDGARPSAGVVPPAPTPKRAEAPAEVPVVLPPYEPPGADAARPLGVAAQRALDAAARGAIERGEVPGAVLAVVMDGELVFERAYGSRALAPAVEPMTVDTVFDLSSVTKAVVTATSVLALVEDGKLRLDEPVATYLPDFAANGKEAVTVAHLLHHTSGLAAVNHLSEYRVDRATALANVRAQPLGAAPGARTLYSDIGYIALGDLVEHVTGERLDAFAARRIFGPLGMTSTHFALGEESVRLAAPTERRKGEWLRGTVHDPRAELLGGVAGHAGAFSTAGDLARFTRVLLHRGYDLGGDLLAPTSVQELLAPAEAEGRSAGLTPLLGGVGHTGFTGTLLWLDPSTDAAVVLLTSRLHPGGDGDAAPLRREIVGIVRSVIASTPPPPLRTGIDVLERSRWAPLAGARVGLVTNHTGTDANGLRTADVLARSGAVKLVAIFSPEHGVSGAADAAVESGRDEATGVPVYSLYGANMRPTPSQLEGLDVIVFDVQDAGARFYTYITTMGYVLEAAAKRGIRFVVLDRPNPLGGLVVEGPLMDREKRSFTGYHEIPVRHGMTVGELALMFNEERGIGADVGVVRMKGWRRSMRFDALGRDWPTPSPNLRSLTAAHLYPGVALLETTNVSVGRGTDHPFEQIGAPWIDGVALADAMNQVHLPGVRFEGADFTPSASTFRSELCHGVALRITDPEAFRPVRTGLALAVELRRAYPDRWKAKGYGTLLANDAVLGELLAGADVARLEELSEAGRAAFEARRRRFLLY